jgi:predicted nucleotidyltransferase
METGCMTDFSDYNRYVDRFVKTMSPLEDVVCSIILFGSVVHGTVRPGYSDLLDAMVLLDPAVLRSEQIFYRVLDFMVEACKDLSASGLPFHPFGYSILEKSGYTCPANLLLGLTLPQLSKVLGGADVRSRVQTNDSNLHFVRGWFYASRRMTQRRAALLLASADRQNDANRIIRAICKWIKTVPQLACLACNKFADRSEAISTIAELCPEIDAAQLRIFFEIREQPGETFSPGEPLRLLQKVREMNESLAAAVTDRMKRAGEWDQLQDMVAYEPVTVACSTMR